LDTFLQIRFALAIVNAGSIALGLAAVIATLFFLGPNISAKLMEKCAYQFSPWIVFIIFFWGVVENNWVPKSPTRNNIIAAAELIGSIVSAIVALALFTRRHRSPKTDPMP
jgi:ABC-type uncharacterized transport system permease subunit